MATDNEKTKFYNNQLKILEKYIDETVQYWLDNDLPITPHEAVTFMDQLDMWHQIIAFNAYDATRSNNSFGIGSGLTNIISRRLTCKRNLLLYIYQNRSIEKIETYLNEISDAHGEEYFIYELSKYKKKSGKSNTVVISSIRTEDKIMYEKYLSFAVIPKAENETVGIVYKYQFFKDELISMSVAYDPKSETLFINEFSKSHENVDVEYGYHHLGTNLFVDMLVDLECRLGFKVKKIKGKLEEPDKKRGNWKKSIPFYAHLSRFIEDKIGRKVSFFLVDMNNDLIWNESFGYDITDDLDDIIKSHKDMVFIYTLHY